MLLGAADALRRAAATPLPPVMRARVDEVVEAVRGGLGATTFDEQWTVGQSLTAEAAVELALQPPS